MYIYSAPRPFISHPNTLPMKKTILSLFIAVVSLTLWAQGAGGTVDISVTTKPNGDGYSPKHVLAIWIEDSEGGFVKTLKLRGDKRKQYLYTWNDAASGNTTDATTGSTLSSHQTHSVSWNCSDVSGETVADGEYQCMIEYTSEHAQGPKTALSFNISAESFAAQPEDLTYFTAMDIVFTPEETTGTQNVNKEYQFSVYPVPASDLLHVSMVFPEPAPASLTLYGSDAREVGVLWSGVPLEGSQDLHLNISEHGVAPGTYFLILKSDNHLSTRQIIIGE